MWHPLTDIGISFIFGVMKQSKMIQRSVAVPEAIDQLALSMLQDDPDMTYSMAIRRILRAGKQNIEEQRSQTTSTADGRK